jgi:C-terminal processing protease CtpA/Prc
VVAVVLTVGLLWPVAPIRAQAGSDSVRIARLATLGRVWNAARFLHPWLAYRDIDWDSALVHAVPLVNAARDTDAYLEAVQSMLDALGDPATRVIRARPNETSTETLAQPESRWTDDRVLVVSINDYAALDDFEEAVPRLQAIGLTVDSARALVLDLRATQSGEQGILEFVLSQTNMPGHLVGERLVGPAARSRMHSGYRAEAGGADYYSGWQILDGPVIEPSQGAEWRPIAVLANDRSELPGVALALIASGRAMLVADGSLPPIGVTTASLPLENGSAAALRVSEVYPSGAAAVLAPDTTVIDDDAFAVALAWVRSANTRSARRAPTPMVEVVPSPPRPYPTMRYPTLGYRLLAAFRIWGVFEYFNPYRHLIESEWDDVLEDFIPVFEAARDSLEYGQAAAAMLTRTHDSHVGAASPTLAAWRGMAPVPMQWRWIEEEVVVTRLTDSAAVSAGFQVGDVVRAVDGVPVDSLIARFAPFVTASTPQRKMFSLMGTIGRGPRGSEARVLVEREGGAVHELTVLRDVAYGPGLVAARDGDILRMLPGNVGYADLDRLPYLMVDSMFRTFEDTDAIILDMRGYPLGTAWAIAPRLTARDDVPAALFRRPMVTDVRGTGEIRATQVYEFTQHLPPPVLPTYRGRTVMLIDERTISQAEHTGLFFEAANGTVFIGTPTAGANGDVTSFVLPGGIRVGFTGQEVRHADGRQLQRLGLQPHVVVAPTIAGIRAGRDEVVERALEYLRTTN